MTRLFAACLLLLACGKEASKARPTEGSASAGSGAGSAQAAPAWTPALPDGAVEYARERKRVFRGIESQVVWVAARQDSMGLMSWLQANRSMLDDTTVTIQGARDPGVPQQGQPSWAQTVIMFAPKSEGERCAPCFDAFGKKVAEPVEGCDC